MVRLEAIAAQVTVLVSIVAAAVMVTVITEAVGAASRGTSGGGNRSGDHRGWSIPGHGFYFASIPSYCKLVYWGGAAYYYADDIYYEWNGTAGAYQEVQPPAGLGEQIAAQAPVVTELFVFPNGNQSNEELERDRETCHRWAVQQVGFDPKAAAPPIKASDRSAGKACKLPSRRRGLLRSPRLQCGIAGSLNANLRLEPKLGRG